jgi:hypothetical protein
MNVTTENVAAQFLFWKYLFPIFGISSLQCSTCNFSKDIKDIKGSKSDTFNAVRVIVSWILVLRRTRGEPLVREPLVRESLVRVSRVRPAPSSPVRTQRHSLQPVYLSTIQALFTACVCHAVGTVL